VKSRWGEDGVDGGAILVPGARKEIVLLKSGGKVKESRLSHSLKGGGKGCFLGG